MLSDHEMLPGGRYLARAACTPLRALVNEQLLLDLIGCDPRCYRSIDGSANFRDCRRVGASWATYTCFRSPRLRFLLLPNDLIPDADGIPSPHIRFRIAVECFGICRGLLRSVQPSRQGQQCSPRLFKVGQGSTGSRDPAIIPQRRLRKSRAQGVDLRLVTLTRCKRGPGVFLGEALRTQKRN